MAEGAVEAAVTARRRGPQMFALFGESNYRSYWVANFFYFLVFGVQRFAFVYFVLEVTGRAGLAGAIGFALGIPAFFVTVPAGVWADRFDRRRMVQASMVGGAAVMAAVAGLAWAGLLSAEVALGMALVVGFANSTVQPPLASIVPMIVAPPRLMNGIVLRTVGQNLAQFFGAALGGLAIALLDFGGAFALQGVFYVVAALAIWAVRLPSTAPAEAGSRPSMRAAARDGLRFVWSDRALRGLMIISMFSGFFMLGPTFVLVPEIARVRLGVGVTANSLLMAFTAVGMITMSLWLASRSELHRKGNIFVTNLLIAGPVIIWIGLSPWYAATALFMLLWGFGGGIFINMNQTLIQTNTPNALMGRVMSIYALSIAGIIPLGSLVAGAGAEVLGAHGYLALSGVVLAGCALWAFLTQHELRALD